MRLLWAGVIVLGAALSASSQMRLSVNQLVSFVESSIRLKHDDRRIAEYLRKVELTQRLEPRIIEELQGKGAGPKTLEALRRLEEASRSLPNPPPVAPQPKPASIPPPSPAEQKRIIEAVRAYAMSYTRRLPDFICTQVTRRYFDPSGLEFWQTVDTITEKLTYFEQKEDYQVILINGRPTDIPHHRLDGASSSGEFGSMMREIFDPASEAEFRWERWGTLRGRRNHVYSYRVAQSKSKWRIDYQRSMSIVPAYRGLIYVDADLMTVSRITLEAVDIPPAFPIQQARTILDYDFIKIGDSEHVLPLRAEVRMREGRNLVKNEVEFRMYRKFGAEATIRFETPEPLPQEMIQEQPIKP